LLDLQSNTGEKSISPGPTIFEGKYWLVEHAYPVKTIGWIVIVLKRHAEALHDLTTKEFARWAQIQSKLIPLLHEELHCEKEYVSCKPRWGIFAIFIPCFCQAIQSARN
jgi:hypothetical protein